MGSLESLAGRPPMHHCRNKWIVHEDPPIAQSCECRLARLGRESGGSLATFKSVLRFSECQQDELPGLGDVLCQLPSY